MEIILLDRVANVGQPGDRVRVRAGFARNYLFPQSKALPATPENVAYFEAERSALEAQAAERLQTAQTLSEHLAALSICIPMQADEEGRLFGSVGVFEIVRAVEAAGASIEKRHVRLPNGPIRHIGEAEVMLILHSDVELTLTVEVVAKTA